ncbi:MAG: nucleoside recognition protein [Ignavibacteria bacterium RBG_13_36_8]|nr:MAG: nucleoside recognition protein [Ignavibacteria bacterium RBG_13_36_8]
MLNYVWLGLLFFGIAAALSTDIIDQSTNRYRNGEALPVTIIFDKPFNKSSAETFSSTININAEDFNKFYNQSEKKDISQKAQITVNPEAEKIILFMRMDEQSPMLWKEMAKVSGNEDDLSGNVRINRFIDSTEALSSIYLEDISFAKMKEVTNSAIDYAGTAVKIALGLIGIMALWLGVMKIAEEAGLIKKIANAVKPITRFLFPDVPADHPAMGSMIMNISANMLGLGNAATPFGLKAMEDLDKLNKNKGTATNAMCTFLAINTAGLTLIPATAIAIRAASGSSDPAIIIGTSFFGAACATFTGIAAAKILEKFPVKKGEFKKKFNVNLRNLSIFLAALVIIAVFIITGIFGKVFSFLGIESSESLKKIIQIFSTVAIPLIIFTFVTYGAVKKVKLYEAFVEGAKEGFNVAVRIIPYLVAMLVAIGIFRAGGAMDFLVMILSPVTSLIGMPAEALPMALMRPLSGSGSLGIMAEIISVHGPDSFIGILVSTIMGSTETTFYVITLYFGTVNIRRTRHAIAAGLLADVAGILGAVFIVNFLFG